MCSSFQGTHFQFIESDIYSNIRKKMIAYLESPQAKYNPVRMLNHFPKDSLLEEKAILLGNLKHHEKVFEIYATKLQNHKAAENYCAKHYNGDSEDHRDVYLELFRVYLDGKERNSERALNLLKRHHDKMNLTKVKIDLRTTQTLHLHSFFIFLVFPPILQ